MKTKSTSHRISNRSLFHLKSAGRVTTRRFRNVLDELPPLTGEPIEVEFHQVMRVHRRHLRLGGSEGSEIHGASSIRERRIH